MKISILQHPTTKNTSYVVIPFLESIYTKYNQSIFKMINTRIPDIELDDKYKVACSAIDAKFQNKLINIATITVSLNMIGGSSKYKISKRTKKVSSHRLSSSIRKNTGTHQPININSLGANLIQIYIIRINDNSKETSNMLEELRVTGHLIFSILKGNFIRNVNIIPILGTDNSGTVDYEFNDSIQALLEGIMLSSYKFDKYKTNKALEKYSAKEVYYLENLYLVTSVNKNLTGAIARLEKIVASVFLARDLVNEPANDNRFERFVARVKEFIVNMNIGETIEIEIWNKAHLEKMNMGLILGVGKGSTPKNAPCMLIIKYHPHKKSRCKSQSNNVNKNNVPDWVLLGKGITFDTGGLDLKKPRHMLDMKSDLSGAAAVVAFLLGYASNGGDKYIYVMCPFAENSISASAIKPSDVLKAYDGRTVEVIDTDAEGRLVLADALAYTVSKWPSARLMDLATLTGQAEDISGKVFSCVLSSNADRETEELITSSNRINEALVRLPILDKELSKLESDVADLKNVSFKSSADIILSSLFMKQFINFDTKWIHIDIAGPAFKADEVIKYASPEASGVGVRMLFEYFFK